jgi:branched-chain amino acid transport system substrate-binding protein
MKLMKQVRWLGGVVAVVALSSLAIAACGDDDGDTSASTTARPASSGSASTGGSTTTRTEAPDSTGGAANPELSEISLGVVAELTGAQSSATAGLMTVATAWEKWVNTELGGIGGHPVKLHVVDDKGDPATGLAVVNELVEDKHVVAMVGSQSNVNSAYSDYLLDKRVPVIGGGAYYPPSWENPMFFPIDASSLTVTQTVGGISAAAGGTKLGFVYCAEVAQCQAVEDLIKPSLAANNIEYVGGVAAAYNASNYTAECLVMRDAGADVVYVATNADVHTRLVSDCARQGYTPYWIAGPTASRASILEQTGNTAMYMGTFPWWADHAGAEEYRTVMGKYADDTDWMSVIGTNAWTSFEFFRQEVLPNPTATPTNEDVLAGLYALHDANLDGLMANKVSYAEGEPVNPGWPCVFPGVYEDGAAVPNDLSEVVCAK